MGAPTRLTPEAFPDDDGSLQYAKAAGIYIEGAEAPVYSDRVLPRPIVSGRALVLLAFGQSNAANAGEPGYVAKGKSRVFNVLDSQFYQASDPLPGASNSGGAVWGRVADRLIAGHSYEEVIVASIAFGGTFITDWAPGGPYHRRLMFAVHRLRMAKLEIGMLCWQQGEAEANLTDMSAETYRGHFLAITRALRAWRVFAPIFVAIATVCDNDVHPFKNHAAIRSAQRSLVSIGDRILPGPDADELGSEFRIDGCHFSVAGLDRLADAWCRALARRSLVGLADRASWPLWSALRSLSRGRTLLEAGGRRLYSFARRSQKP